MVKVSKVKIKKKKKSKKKYSFRELIFPQRVARELCEVRDVLQKKKKKKKIE